MFALLIEEQLFQKAIEYVDGNIDLRELEEWLLPNLETILDHGNDESIALAELLEVGAIELQVGVSSKEALVSELRKLLTSRKFMQDIDWASIVTVKNETWDLKVIEDGEIMEDREGVEDEEFVDQPQTFELELQVI